MNKINENTEKEKNGTAKGAIFLVYPKSTLSGDPATVSKAAGNSDINSSNMRRIMTGSTNSNLDTYEKCAEALGKRLVISEVADTTELNLILAKNGIKKDSLFWKMPYNKDFHSLTNFMLKIYGIDEIPQSFNDAVFQLLSVLSAAANKKGMENQELLAMIKRFKREAVEWATNRKDGSL